MNSNEAADARPNPDDPHAAPTQGVALTPVPPSFAVIFTSLRTPGDRGCAQMADRMLELAAKQPGFLAVESARGNDGPGITVSYWANAESIAAWKAHSQHLVAQEAGRRVWYAGYQLRVARVVRDAGNQA